MVTTMESTCHTYFPDETDTPTASNVTDMPILLLTVLECTVAGCSGGGADCVLLVTPCRSCQDIHQAPTARDRPACGRQTPRGEQASVQMRSNVGWRGGLCRGEPASIHNRMEGEICRDPMPLHAEPNALRVQSRKCGGLDVAVVRCVCNHR